MTLKADSYFTFLIILTIDVSFVIVLHYYTITLKKESNGIYRIKNNIIYYIYNYYLPLYPLKNVDFSESMIWGSWQYGE